MTPAGSNGITARRSYRLVGSGVVDQHSGGSDIQRCSFRPVRIAVYRIRQSRLPHINPRLEIDGARIPAGPVSAGGGSPAPRAARIGACATRWTRSAGPPGADVPAMVPAVRACRRRRRAWPISAQPTTARQVVVADADGVRVAVRALHDFRGGPHADARARCAVRRSPGRRLARHRPCAAARLPPSRRRPPSPPDRGSTPARCHSQEGIRPHSTADGHTLMPSGAGPGAAEPNLVTNSRQDRRASAPTTRCSSTAGTSDSKTSAVRGMRSPGTARRVRCSSGWLEQSTADQSSPAPSSSGSWSSAHAAPGPQAVART